MKTPTPNPAHARTRRADPSKAGIRRRRRGKGFSYEHPSGRAVKDEQTLDRIRALAIPPAWEDVWISPDEMGHIQATGVDAAGRTQYRYHESWSQRASDRKFDEMRDFARALPRLRRAVTRDLKRDGMPRERALAVAVRLLDLGLFRVGGERYAEENESFGLATVRKEHVHISGSEVLFDFPAKSGQRRRQSIRDPSARRAIEKMYRRRGGIDDLLAFQEDGVWRDIRSHHINDYVREHAGEQFSAKDFRTWHGTVLAAVELAAEPELESGRAFKRSVSRAVERVAAQLGNTPAVCRRSYIDPRVIEAFRDGNTVALPRAVNGALTVRRRHQLERAVLELVS